MLVQHKREEQSNTALMEVRHTALNHFAGAEAVIHKDNPGVAQALQKGDTHCTCAYKRRTSVGSTFDHGR